MSSRLIYSKIPNLNLFYIKTISHFCVVRKKSAGFKDLHKTKLMDKIDIVEYNVAHQPYFEKFNRDWIEKYFWLEEIDKYVLQHPQEAIIDKGGAVLMATCNDEVAGTVALKKVNDEVVEFTKMAVMESFRRRGIAEALSHASFEKAKALGFTKIILYSNRKLSAAITMYHKLGFVEVPIEPGVYERSDIKMERELYPLTNYPKSAGQKKIFNNEPVISSN